MSIKTRKPPMKQTVGAQYVCFESERNEEFKGEYEETVEKTEVVKTVKMTENSETSDTFASGKYMIQTHQRKALTLKWKWLLFQKIQLRE